MICGYTPHPGVRAAAPEALALPSSATRYVYHDPYSTSGIPAVGAGGTASDLRPRGPGVSPGNIDLVFTVQ